MSLNRLALKPVSHPSNMFADFISQCVLPQLDCGGNVRGDCFKADFADVLESLQTSAGKLILGCIKTTFHSLRVLYKKIQKKFTSFQAIKLWNNLTKISVEFVYS